MLQQNSTDMRHWYAHACGSFVSTVAGALRQFGSNARRMKTTLLMSIAVALVFGSLAVAQSADPAAEAGAILDAAGGGHVEATNVGALPSGQNVSGLISAVATAVDQAIKGIQNNKKLRDTGEVIAGFAVAIMMLWSAVRTMISGKGLGELFGEWVPIWVAYGVVVAVVNQDAGSQIERFMNSVASAISGYDVSNVKTVITQGLQGTFDSVFVIADMPTIDTSSWGAALTGNLITMVMDKLAVLILKMISMFVLVIAGCIYVATSIMAMVSIALVLALAPIMVPFLIFSPMSWLFDSWLRFLMGACMMKVVGAFMLALTSGLVAQMTNVAKTLKTDMNGAGSGTLVYDLLLYAFLILLAVLAALLMQQVPTIATGLLQGSAGGAGFKGIGGVANNAAGKMATSAGTKAYQNTAGSSIAAARGRSDAVNGIASKSQRYGNNAQDRSYQVSHARASSGIKGDVQAAAKSKWKD